MNNGNYTLQLNNICKSFENNEYILRGVELTLLPGELCAIISPSGSGKTTILQIAGLLENANEGTVAIDGVVYKDINSNECVKTRRSKIGFIYQFHHLLPELSVLENVMMPLIINKIYNYTEAIEPVIETLKQLNIEHIAKKSVSTLSGGEKQRAAIARAVIHKPKIIIADEPTGNLDPTNSNNVFRLLSGIAQEKSISILIATHNKEIYQYISKATKIIDKKLVPVTIS